MKKSTLAVAVLMSAFAFVSCNGSSEQKAGATEAVAEAPAALNFKYVNMDSVSKHYTLAKELMAEYEKEAVSFQNLARQKENEIQKHATQLEKNYQAGHYLTESSIQAAQKEFQNKQLEAQNVLRSREEQLVKKELEMLQRINDSIRGYMKDLCLANGYDAVLDSKVTYYVNPELDVTDAVVKGLNDRYKPAAKK